MILIRSRYDSHCRKTITCLYDDMFKMVSETKLCSPKLHRFNSGLCGEVVKTFALRSEVVGSNPGSIVLFPCTFFQKIPRIHAKVHVLCNTFGSWHAISVKKDSHRRKTQCNV
uniref:Uncharacterized protein n=1 Tax=Arion vulgaris TaxID=1028688 RepID=A0A0B7ASH0_9EUPU